MMSNIYLKFSSLYISKKEDEPFSNMFGNTSKSIISDFTPDDIVNMSDEDMINFISETFENNFNSDEIIFGKDFYYGFKLVEN